MSSAEHVSSVTEPVRPQSLPLSSSNRVISHTELRSQQSSTPPSSLASHQQTLNPPPPLIQMSSLRDKKFVMAQDLTPIASRSREGFSHSEAYHDRYLHASQETTLSRDVSRHSHTPVDTRGGEREKCAPVVETVDLTRDREVSTSSLTRPTARSPVVALGSSSARATLQAMARYASADTGNVEVTEKIDQKEKEDTYLPPRPPDLKLSVYEQNEAIRKFTALGNVCVSASREFPGSGEYPSQPYAFMTMQGHHQPHGHSRAAGTSTPPPYGYPIHVGHPMATFHHHPEHRFMVPVGVHQLPVREMLSQSVNGEGEDLPSHLKLTGAYAHQYSQGAAYYPTSMRSVVPSYQAMNVCGHRYPVPMSEERRALHHSLDMPVRRQNEISEQDLANPFVVKQPKQMHASGMTERVVSPGDLPKFPLPSRSPVEPAKRPPTISPEMKPQIAAHAEVAKTVSPVAVNYLSRVPSRPASVSEMRNRAAVIPTLTNAEGAVQKFPDPQPVVLAPSSKHSVVERIAMRTDDEPIRGDTKGRTKEDKTGSLTEVLPMSAFATLVDVAAAASKVDVPTEEHILQKESIKIQERQGSPSVRLTGSTVISPSGVTSPPSPSRTSPGASSGPRYGITTGLVPKPPPLMPITGMRPLQESSSSSPTPISISITGLVNVPVCRSPSKLTSPPGSRSARASVSPDGPPPLIPHTVISPTSTNSSQGTSPKGPPPLIKGIVPTVLPALRSPEHDAADSVRTTRSNQEQSITLSRPDQETSVSRGPFPQKGMLSVDVDFQPKFGMHLNEPGPSSSQVVDAKNRSASSHATGQAQVRTIFETITYVDSSRAEARQPSKHQAKPYQPPATMIYRSDEYPPFLPSSSPMFTETTEKEDTAMSRSWRPKEKEDGKNLQSHLQQERSSRDQKANADEREKVFLQMRQKVSSFQQVSQVGHRDKNFPLQQNEQPAEAAISRASGSETEEGEEGDEGDDGGEQTEDEVPLLHSFSASLHPRIRALTKSYQGSAQSPYYDASDSETLSAEESEVLPESSDEMFPSTTVKLSTQSDSGSEGGKDDEHESILSDSRNTADTFLISPNNTDLLLLGSSTLCSKDGDEKAEKSGILREHKVQYALQDTVTSTGPVRMQVLDVNTEEPRVDSQITSTFFQETDENVNSPDANQKREREVEVSVYQDTRDQTNAVVDHDWNPSQSSSGDSSEAIPCQESGEVEGAERLNSSEDNIVGSSETDKGAGLSQLVLSDQQSLQAIPDSSANLENRPDDGVTSPAKGNVDSYGQKVLDDVVSMETGDNKTAAQSSTDLSDEVVSEVTYEQATRPLEKDDSVYVYPSTSEIERESVVSTLLDQGDEEDGEVNETNALVKPSTEHEFLIEPDTCSSSSDNHHPEISSAVDCVSDDGEQVSYPTFIGEFVPLSGEVDSPDIRSGCSTHIPSDEGSVCDDMPAERDIKEVGHPVSPKQEPIQEEPCDVLSPDEGVQHPDDTLSEGEIPPSQESSQSDDDLVSTEDKAALVLAHASIGQSSWHPKDSHPITDLNQRPLQVTEDDQLSEGEIPESEDEPTMEPSRGSPSSNTVALSCTLLSGDVRNATASERVSLSQDITARTDCYINMIPISPAPPESPSHESQGDRTSPLPPWPSIESQHPSVVSLSLAARMTSKGTPFPYSTLSINVGSASSSARSSPVPQSFSASLAPGSSPSSSSLLARPQEPTPLLSDNYEPLSDDENDEGLADSSNMSDKHNI